MKSTVKINIQEILGKNTAISTEDGNKVFSIIKTNFISDNKVVLDFNDIKLIVTAFFNAAIGQLYSEYESPFLQENLHLINISKEDILTLKYATDRAKEFFLEKKNTK